MSKSAPVLLVLLVTACGPTERGRPDGAVGGTPDASFRVDARPPGDGPVSVDAASADAASSDAAVADAATADAEPSPDAAGTDGGIVAYSHTIAIDGVNDFTAADELLATSSGSYSGYAAWDADYLYLGMTGPDVGSNDGSRFWLIYLSGTTATQTGVAYRTQEPALPFAAGYHLRWKADNSFTGALTWSGSDWTDPAWDFTGDIYQTGTYVELRIPRADLGAPTQVSLAMAMINETQGSEFTFAGVPSTTFTDGYDPDWTGYYSFDLTDSQAPAAYSPLP